MHGVWWRQEWILMKVWVTMWMWMRRGHVRMVKVRVRSSGGELRLRGTEYVVTCSWYVVESVSDGVHGVW